MNNENNENKRIDLTQFEKILNGPWSLVDGSEQYIIGADIGTGRDLIMATVDQTIDEVMAWDDEPNRRMPWMVGNYNLPSKEEGIEYATAKAVQILPDLIAELKRMYEREDELMEILSILEDRHDIDMSQFDASE
tara:strand:+ start:2194 stop:2598 length:405 start_codon:yes stop_codon:yes gene_type:complete